MSAVLLNDGVYGRKTQAGAGLLRGKERFEYPREMLRGDPEAGVGDLQPEVMARRQGRDRAALKCFVAKTELDHPTARHGLHGVDHKVLHHLTDLTLIDIGRPQVGLDFVFAAHRRPVQRKLRRLAHHVLQEDRRPHRLPALGKREQLLGELFRPQRPTLRFAQPFSTGRVDLFIHHRERQIPHHDREEVVEIVGDAARKHANGLHLRGAQ